MREKKQLVLNISNLTEKADKFYRQMDTSLKYRETFLRDPVGILSKDLLGGTCNNESIWISKMNRLLFALLSNTKFMEWAKDFENDVQSKINAAVNSDDPKIAEKELAAHLNRTYYYRKIVQAMFDSLDVETYEALLNLGRDSSRTSPADQDVKFNVKYNGTDQISISLDPSISSLAEKSMGDVTVCVYIAVYAVAAIAVFAFATAAVAIMEVPKMLSRTDLQRITSFVTKELTQRSHLLRKEGELSINLPERNAIFDNKNNQSQDS
ncbi:hypothetical protein [Bacillus wiedmannii]|uniref:hypothetical protein n=1 Tax=Bacillus wiedmannii TaxID=1890302 RepID=UPI000B43BC16|nr:hypothetical protein BK740_14200 [Bacillus thuringiensis serovar argentinensis]